MAFQIAATVMADNMPFGSKAFENLHISRVIKYSPQAQPILNQMGLQREM